MTCEKPSCKTSAERKEVRQRGDGLSNIRIQQAINGPIFLKIQMKRMQFTLEIKSEQSKQIFTIPFFLLNQNLLHNKIRLRNMANRRKQKLVLLYLH